MRQRLSNIEYYNDPTIQSSTYQNFSIGQVNMQTFRYPDGGFDNSEPFQ